MSFLIAQQTLESLQWPEVVALLRTHCRTPIGHQFLGEDDAGLALLEPGVEAMRERLAETSEARSILDAGDLPPLQGVFDLEAALGRAEKGGILEPQQLVAVQSTVAALHATAGFLANCVESAPRLADLASTLPDERDLERDLARCLDPSGAVRDDASPALADAKRQAGSLGSELQKRLERFLHDADVTPYLSDQYYTVRNDRYVLPVKADFRGRVRGIVHDASNSGTTLFIEPESVVELNNRLKQSELAAKRELQRVLRRLSESVGRAAEPLRAALAALRCIDLAFARGRLSQELEGVEPEVGREGVLRLQQLHHPLLPASEAVPNDLVLGEGYHMLVISGPNAGGKTVAMKSLGLAALFTRAGLHLPALPGARVDVVDTILADIGDGQDIGESLSTFSAHMASLSRIVQSATPRALVLLDEVGVGTDPAEGAALAQAVLESLADAGARVVATTHYNLLKELADVDPRFCNASVEFDAETLAPTYRLHIGTPGASSATAVASRMGMPNPVLERANALLAREDRQLDRMLSELAASRTQLEEEQRVVAQLRADSEAARDEYREKLERLQERRDKLFQSMREDLDRAFQDAHGQVAAVIRGLQRGDATAQDAAHARERLLALEAKARTAQTETGESTGDAKHAVDWRKARAGDRVCVPGGGSGLLESLPDRRGRVRVRVGSNQLVLAADQVRSGSPDPSARTSRGAVSIASADPLEGASGGTLHCDLRGLRVDEALDRLAEFVDRALAQGRDELHIVHGLGTGALKRAVRQSLNDSPYVSRSRPAATDAGGEGVTIATLGG